jgi:hypothetical protein
MPASEAVTGRGSNPEFATHQLSGGGIPRAATAAFVFIKRREFFSTDVSIQRDVLAVYIHGAASSAGFTRQKMLSGP